jgi:hypothetical protein
MSEDKKIHDLYQNCILTLSDGSTAVFTGKAVFFEGEKRKITDTKFTDPKELPEGYYFERHQIN